MEIISKNFKNIKQAENFLNDLYLIYSFATCVHIPVNNNGMYIFKVKK